MDEATRKTTKNPLIIIEGKMVVWRGRSREAALGWLSKARRKAIKAGKPRKLEYSEILDV